MTLKTIGLSNFKIYIIGDTQHVCELGLLDSSSSVPVCQARTVVLILLRNFNKYLMHMFCGILWVRFKKGNRKSLQINNHNLSCN